MFLRGRVHTGIFPPNYKYQEKVGTHHAYNGDSVGIT